MTIQQRVTVPGGLKLALQGSRDDRRLRFAEVKLSTAGDAEDLVLVTDADGRLRYRLPAGEYTLHLADGQDVSFAVGDGRWTPVRVDLPA